MSQRATDAEEEAQQSAGVAGDSSVQCSVVLSLMRYVCSVSLMRCVRELVTMLDKKLVQFTNDIGGALVCPG